MGGQGHFSGEHHVLPGHVTDFTHIVAVGAGEAALAAQGAGVDGLVHHVVAHDDGHVVVDFPGENPGEFLIMAQIGAAFQAFLAPALNAPPGLRLGVLPAGNRDAAGTGDSFQGGVQPGFRGPFFPTGVGRVQVLGQTVGGQGGFLRSEGGPQHSLDGAGEQLVFPADHQRFLRFQAGEYPSCQVKVGGGKAEEILLGFQSLPGVTALAEGDFQIL